MTPYMLAWIGVVPFAYYTTVLLLGLMGLQEISDSRFLRTIGGICGGLVVMTVAFTM